MFKLKTLLLISIKNEWKETLKTTLDMQTWQKKNLSKEYVEKILSENTDNELKT